MKEDRAAVPIPPPLFFFACLGAGFLLELAFPTRAPGWPWPARIVGGLIPFAASGFLALGAFRALKRNRTPFDPSRPTVKIVEEGSYRFSRNPLYLALLLLLGAAAVLACSIWLLLAVPILFLLLKFLAIRPEEHYLEQKFGDEYLRYRASVRRWI